VKGWRLWAPTAVVVALLAATAVAFATTERQKLEKTPFAVLHVDATVSPARAPALIELRLHRPHLLTVQIVDKNGRPVATLAHEQRYERGNAVFHWRPNVPDGVYEPRVTLDDGRQFDVPANIRVDSVAPTATLVSYHPHVLPGDATRVRIAYRVSEPAHILLYVGGRRELTGFAKSLQYAVNWYARRQGQRLAPGRYRLQLAAVDLAGNVGGRTPAFVVDVR
jgi:hypothetical protein